MDGYNPFSVASKGWIEPQFQSPEAGFGYFGPS